MDVFGSSVFALLSYSSGAKEGGDDENGIVFSVVITSNIVKMYELRELH